MKQMFTAAAFIAAAAAVACSASRDNRSGISTDLTGGATRSAGRSDTAIVGCLESGKEPGTYRLVARSDTVDQHPAATTGDGRSGATTGLGGDTVRDSSTIGAGMIRQTYLVIPGDGGRDGLDAQVGSDVSIVGEIEDSATASGGDADSAPAHTIRARSVTRVASPCRSTK